MTRAQKIAATLTGILEGDPWYGPSVRATLQGITAVAAAAQPIEAAHSIWQLVTHMNAWNHVCLRRMAGEAVEEPPINFQRPEAITPEEWRQVQFRLDESCRMVIVKASLLTDSELAVIAPDQTYTIDFMLEGLGQHWAYHAGQIGLLRRAVMG